MKYLERKAIHARTLLFLLALPPLLAGCDDHHHYDDDDDFYVDVFREQEPNDDAFQADYFGVLLPGDHFFIDGYITDNGFDPFDGFAFVAGEPIHVDFLLYQQDSWDDFDVCLYDPQLDATVACFATELNPEAGGADIIQAGLEFHLLVESYIGEGAYSLEIQVSSLRVARAASEAGSVQATSSASEGRQPRGLDEYGRAARGQKAADRTVLLSIDPESGERTETVRTLEDASDE